MSIVKEDHLPPSCAVPSDGSLSPDSCCARRMLLTAESGQLQTLPLPLAGQLKWRAYPSVALRLRRRITDCACSLEGRGDHASLEPAHSHPRAYSPTIRKVQMGNWLVCNTCEDAVIRRWHSPGRRP